MKITEHVYVCMLKMTDYPKEKIYLLSHRSQTYADWFQQLLRHPSMPDQNSFVRFNHWLKSCDPLLNVYHKQGKSEGFESCDRPIVRKRPIWVKIGDVLYRVTLKFDGWPKKTIEHLSFAVSNFVQHFIAIGKFKLELQSGNGQFGSNSTIFRAGWPWNLTYDLQKQ